VISDRTLVLSPGVPRFGGSPPSPSALPRSSARRSRERGSCRVTVGRGAQRCSVVRASQLLVATAVAALLGTPAKVSDGVAPDPVEQRRAT